MASQSPEELSFHFCSKQLLSDTVNRNPRHAALHHKPIYEPYTERLAQDRGPGSQYLLDICKEAGRHPEDVGNFIHQLLPLLWT